MKGEEERLAKRRKHSSKLHEEEEKAWHPKRKEGGIFNGNRNTLPYPTLLWLYSALQNRYVICLLHQYPRRMDDYYMNLLLSDMMLSIIGAIAKFYIAAVETRHKWGKAEWTLLFFLLHCGFFFLLICWLWLKINKMLLGWKGKSQLLGQGFLIRLLPEAY